MAAQSGVMLRFSVAPMVEKLSDADAGAVFKSVFDYAANGTIPDFSERPMADLVWAGLRPLIDKDAEHYSQKCESSAYSAYCREQQRAGLEPLPREVWNIERHRTTSNDTNTIQCKANQNQNNTVQDNSKSNTNQVNTSSAAAAPPTPAPFTPPSLQEVRDYVAQEVLPVDSERFYNYYESVGWRIGQNPMVDWKAACRRWSDKPRGAPAAAPREIIDGAAEQRRMEKLYAELNGENT